MELGRQLTVRPDILADEAAGPRALIIEILGNPVAIDVMQGVDRPAGLRQPPSDLLTRSIVFIFGLHDPAEGKCRHPPDQLMVGFTAAAWEGTALAALSGCAAATLVRSHTTSAT